MTLRPFAFALLSLYVISSTAVAHAQLRKIARFTIPNDHTRRITGGRALALNENGQTALVAFYGSQAQLFDMKSGKAIGSRLRTAGDGNVGFVSDGIAYTADWESMRLWDAKTAKTVGEPIPHVLREDTIISPAISPDGRFIATRNTMNSFQIWAVDSLQLVKESQAYDHEVHSLRFAKDGRLYVRIGNKLHVFESRTGQRVAGPFTSGYLYCPLTKSNRLLTTEGPRKGPQTIVIRSTKRPGWPEINRVSLTGRLRRTVELDESRWLVQMTKADYSPDLFVISADDPQQREPLLGNVDRAFSLRITSNQKHWICNNIHDVSCYAFGKQQPVWSLDYRRNGYNQTLKLLGDDYVVIHEKSRSETGNITTVHKISDGTTVWEQKDLVKVFTHGDKMFVCDSGGMEVWTTD